MDTPAPAAVDDRSLTAVLTQAWSIGVVRLRYVPKGAGSYHWLVEGDERATHFVTVDDLHTKPWIGPNRDATFEGLTAAYETAWVLHHEDHVDAVVAPIRHDDGTVTMPLGERYSVAVFPYVDGTTGSWGDSISRDDRVRLLTELAWLHRATRALHAGLRRRPHDLAERDALLAAITSVDRPWRGGPFSEPARHVLADNTRLVRDTLARFDDLATQLDRSSAEPVVTHGEPHPGNLIHASTGLRIVDWDTVALAEPERDLWMLDDDDDSLHVYSELTGRTIDRAAVEFYRLAWTLSDIASFADMFRTRHANTRWTSQKWQGFVQLVEGASSVPYAP